MQALRGSQQAKCSCSRQQQHSPANSRAVRLLARATSHPQQQPSFTSTAALTAAAAATVLQLCLPAAPALADITAAYHSSSSIVASAPTAAWQPVLGDVAAVAQLPAEQEDFATEILTEELALPPQLMNFMEMLQKVSKRCTLWDHGWLALHDLVESCPFMTLSDHKQMGDPTDRV
jgi:hypothetical protein